MYEVSKDARQRVYKMFDRTETMVDDDVEVIKKWLKTQPHIPETMEDVKIRNFLNLNKFSIEKTKQKIDMYYTIRSLIPDMFENINPKQERLQKSLDLMQLSILPKALDGIHRVVLMNPIVPNCFSPEDIVKLWLCTFEFRLYEDFMVDDIYICDMANITFSDIKKVNPSLVSKTFTIYKKVYSLRMKNLILINSPPYTSFLLNIMKAILKPKIFDRIRVCEDTSILEEVFPKDELPKDYGGNGASLEEMTGMIKKKLSEYKDRYDFLDRLRVNENLRPEKLDNDEILGFYGNFKKLEVD